MPVGSNHQMPDIVWKLVENAEAGITPDGHMARAIFFLLYRMTEDAALLLFVKDVVQSPWGPEVFHFFAFLCGQPPR